MASRSVTKRPSAQRDIVDCTLYIAEDDLSAAERFLDAVEETLQFLVHQPFTGRAEDFGNPRLQGLRCRPVRGFRNYLVF